MFQKKLIIPREFLMIILCSTFFLNCSEKKTDTENDDYSIILKTITGHFLERQDKSIKYMAEVLTPGVKYNRPPELFIGSEPALPEYFKHRNNPITSVPQPYYFLLDSLIRSDKSIRNPENIIEIIYGGNERVYPVNRHSWFSRDTVKIGNLVIRVVKDFPVNFGFLELSPVIIDNKKMHAVCAIFHYCGPKCARTSVFCLSKKNNDWKIIREITFSLS